MVRKAPKSSGSTVLCAGKWTRYRRSWSLAAYVLGLRVLSRVQAGEIRGVGWLTGWQGPKV